MAGNPGAINEVVNPLANKQVTDLEALLAKLEIQFVATAKQADALVKATGGATSFSQFSKAAAESDKATKKIIENNERIKRTIISNSQAEVDAYEKSKRGQEGITETVNARNKAEAKAANEATARSAKAIAQQQAQAKEYVRAQGLIEKLTAKLKFYKQAQIEATDPRVAEKYAQKIQATEKNITQLTNAGKTGFDSLGNAVKKSSNLFSQIGQKAVMLARLLPGIGIVGLIGFAVEPIIEYIAQLDILGQKAEKIITTASDSSEFKSALGAVNSLKTSIDEFNDGTISGQLLVERYNETIGQTAGILTKTAEVERFYNSKADAYVQAMFLRAQANAALEASADKLAEAQKRALGSPTFGDVAKASVTSFFSLVRGSYTGFFTDVSNNQAKAVAQLNAEGKKGFEAFDRLKKESDKFNKENGFGDLDGAKREEARKKSVEDAKRRAKEIADAKEKAEQEAYKLQLENEKNALDARARLLEDYFENEKKIRKESEDDIADSNNARLLNIEKYASMELDVITQLYKNGLISEKEFQERRQDIDREAALQSIDSAIQLSEELINIQKSYGENTQSEEDKLAKLKIARSKLVRDAIIDDLKTEEQKRKELNDKIKELADEAKDFLITVVNAGVTNRKNALQKEADTIEKNKQLEIEAVEKSLLTEQQKADKVAVIEAKAQADKEVIAQKQRQLDVEQAKFNKAIAIAEIIQNTAIAVTKVTAQAGLLGLLTGVPAVIALGAIQIATVLAQPIPTYAEGTDFHPGGKALIGEAGTELVIEPNKQPFLTTGAEITDLARGTMVVSNKELMANSNNPVINQLNLSALLTEQQLTRKELKQALKTKLTGAYKAGARDNEKFNKYLKRNLN